MRKLILSLTILALAFSHNANAQVSITSIATPYTQNFDALSNDTTFTTAHAMTLTGWSIFEKGTSSAVDQQYKVSTGSKNNGETYSYGDSSSTDRALGSVASGTNLPSFGVGFTNNSGSIITDLAITYKGEEWRSGDTSATSLDSLILEYSTSATGINDTIATWNPVASLMLNTPNLTTIAVGSLDGNAAPNFVNMTGSISVLVNIGSTIYIRWRDINKSGSDDGLAVDDLSISFSSAGNPKPSITATTPPDNATGISPTLTNFAMTFDQMVTVGTGNITIKNLTDGTDQVIACGSTTVSATLVSIPGVNLLSGKSYAVNFDSTCYKSSTAANSYGIYDNTSWNFSTQPNGLIEFNKNNIELTVLNNQVLSFNSVNSEAFTLTIVDMNGKIVSQETVNAISGINKMNLNTKGLSSGMYFAKIANAEYHGSVKFVK